MAAMATRHTGIDVARGLAIGAMALVNWHLVLSRRGDHGAWDLPGTLFQGQASALFVVLAGVGIHLLGASRGGGEPGALRRALVRRGGILIASGYLLMLLWPADILHYYGAWFVLAGLLAGLPRWGWAALAAAVTLLFPVLLIAGVDYERHWDFAAVEYLAPWSADGLLRSLLINGYHPTIPWFAFLCLGKAIAPALLRPGARVGMACAVSLAITALARVLSSTVGGDPDLVALLGTESIPPGPLYMVSAGALAVGVITGCVALERQGAFGACARVVAAAGRNALTLYVAHVVVGLVPLAAAFGEHSLHPGVVAGLTILWCAGAFVLCAGRERRGKRGPLEAFFRRAAAGRQAPGAA